MRIMAQVSIYPLRQKHLSPFLGDIWQQLRERHLNLAPGSMSTLVEGESNEVFPALQEAFTAIAQRSDVVMVVTFSNACPAEIKSHTGD